MASIEQFANEASTTLASATTTTATSITVSSSAGFPTLAAGQWFNARIEPATPDGSKEFVKVTAISGTTWTVTRAQEGTTGVAWGVGSKITAVITAATLSGLLPQTNGNPQIDDPSNEIFMRVDIISDGSNTGSWPDRLAFYFDGVRTGYHNEYGELRGRPAKNNTVAMRAMAHSTDPVNQNIFEVTSSGQATKHFEVSPTRVQSAVPVYAPNFPAKVTVASTAPASPTVGDVWIDTSA